MYSISVTPEATLAHAPWSSTWKWFLKKWMVAVASGLNLTCDIPVTADSAMDGHPGGADPPRNHFKVINQSCETLKNLK